MNASLTSPYAATLATLADAIRKVNVPSCGRAWLCLSDPGGSYHCRTRLKQFLVSRGLDRSIDSVGSAIEKIRAG